MRTARVEVRLDSETREKLEEMAAARGSSVSELVRDLIERSQEEVAGAAGGGEDRAYGGRGRAPARQAQAPVLHGPRGVAGGRLKRKRPGRGEGDG